MPTYFFIYIGHGEEQLRCGPYISYKEAATIAYDHALYIAEDFIKKLKSNKYSIIIMESYYDELGKINDLHIASQEEKIKR